MTDRRSFLTGVVAMAATGATHAQQPAKIPRVGVLSFGTKESNVRSIAAFRQRLSELGYVDGKSIRIEERYAEGNPARLDELARELAASNADVIVTVAVAATTAARHATRSIPIVMVLAGNPVGAGLIESLARPGGNVTGTTSMLPDLGGKQLQLLREVVPRAARIAVLANPTNAGTAPYLQNAAAAARSLGVELAPIVEVTHARDFASAFRTIRDAQPDGLDVFHDPIVALQRAQIIAFVASAGLPAIYGHGDFPREGGLISYGPDFVAHFPVAAEYVSQILKGAKPGNLPVQQPTKYELVVNVKTAKALGLKIPQALLLRADEVIQ